MSESTVLGVGGVVCGTVTVSESKVLGVCVCVCIVCV